MQPWMGAALITLTATLSGCAITPDEGGQTFRQRIHIQALTDVTAEDIRAEIGFGREVAARVLGHFPLFRDQALTRYINLVGTALAAQSGRPELNFHFAILDSNSVNAFSAPGGYIFITRGALEMARDEAELAAVLAHEIAHVSERHIVKALNVRASDDSGAAGLGRILSAGADTTRVAFMQAVDQAVKILFENGYSQRDELQADRVATLLLVNTDLDPLALRRYLTRVQTVDKQAEAINTTHPPSAERLESLDRLIMEENLAGLHLAKNTTRFKRYVKTP